MSDPINEMFPSGGGMRGGPALVCVTYDSNGNPCGISGLPDFAKSYVEALAAERDRLAAILEERKCGTADRGGGGGMVTPHAERQLLGRNINAMVVNLARRGLTTRQIAQQTGLTVIAARNRAYRLRKRGVIPSVQEVRYGKTPPPAHPYVKRPSKLGSMMALWRALTEDERRALTAMVPKGATVADFAASVLRDVIAEDAQ